MKNLSKLTARVADLERRLETMQQLAKVSSIDEANHRVNVKIRNLELKGLPFLTWRAGSEAKTYWVPEVGELGLLMCPAGDVGNAFFMPALFYADSEAPESNKNIMLRIFSDGVEEKWDGDDDTYTLSIGTGTERKVEKTSGKIEDKTGTAKLTLERAGTAKFEASPAVKIELTATGVVITAPEVNIVAATLKWNGVPTTPVAWVATT